MRKAIAVAAAFTGLAACCPAPLPPGPASQIYFDSGAAVRIRLRGGGEVRGTLLAGSAPGALELTVCEARHGSCRTVSLGTIEELRYRSNAAPQVAVGGLYAGLLLGYAADTALETPLMPLAGAAGLGLGWVVGSVITTWPVAASRQGSRLLWEQGPMMIPAPPARHDFVTGCARGDSAPRTDLVAVARWARGEFYGDIRRAWRVDSTARLVPVSTEDIRCRNRSPVILTPEDTLRASAPPLDSVARGAVERRKDDKSLLQLVVLSSWNQPVGGPG